MCSSDLSTKLNGRPAVTDDYRALIRAELKDLNTALGLAAVRAQDRATRAHLADARDQIAKALDPKFAPQIGGGHYRGEDEDEPITVEPGASGAPEVPPVTQLAGSPTVPKRPVVFAAWQRQPEPTQQAVTELKAIYLDVPLVALASMCVGFLLGRFRKG